MDEKKFVRENIKRLLVKEFLMRETQDAKFGGIDIVRTPLGTRVILEVERPGLVIGRKGVKIRELTRVLEEKFGLENPQIEVRQCETPALNAQIMAEKLASAIERGWHFRRAGHSTIRRIMEAGAKGALVIISGKLTGDRARTEKFKAGAIVYNGKPSELVRVGYAVAKTKPGVIGITVKILPGDVKLPDEINILESPDVGLEGAEQVAAEAEVVADEGAQGEGNQGNEQ